MPAQQHNIGRSGSPRHNPAAYIDPPPHPVAGAARPAAHPVSGEKRVAGMVTAQRNTLAAKVATREKAFSAAADAVKAAQVTRRRYDTKQTAAALVLAGQNLAFAAEDLAVERAAAQDFEDSIVGSTAQLAQLAQLDALQAEQAILATNQQIVADAMLAGVALAAVLVRARESDAAVSSARGEAQMISKSLGLAWSPSPLGYLQHRVAIRDALRTAFIAAGLDLQVLESCVR